MAAIIQRHYSERAWIEGSAEAQLGEVALLPGMASVSAFPDLHPGKNGPIGIAATASRLFPHLVGNDIGCGFGLFDLGIPVRKLRVDKAEERLRAAVFGSPADAPSALEAAGLPGDLAATALGSIGGGNHFAELTCVEERLGSDVPGCGNVLLLVHTGSRSLGADVWDRTLSRIGALGDGVAPEGEDGEWWKARHDECVAWAALNRRVVAATVAAALRADACGAVCDVPHNLVVADADADGGAVYRHYKGASRTLPGDLVPVAGSRDSLSHLVVGTGVAGSDFGIAHGSGRKRDRASMHGRGGLKRSEREALQRNQWGGRVICDDSDLLLEEQASAYKNPRHVVDDLVTAGLVGIVCSLRPLVTFKKAADTDARAMRRDRTRGRDRDGRR